MKRRDFLKKASLVAALPAAALIGSRQKATAKEYELVHHKQGCPCMSCKVIETSSEKFPYTQFMNPEPKQHAESYWRPTNNVMYKQGDLYYNKLSYGWMQYVVTKKAGGFWRPRLLDPEHPSPSLPCPKHMLQLRNVLPLSAMDFVLVTSALSVVCNTWPFGEVPTTCMCGHRWLAHAHEDYKLWQRGERDKERAHRRAYLPVTRWLSIREKVYNC